MLPPLLLVGPQGPQPDLGAALKEAGVKGPVALITAGWQERESDDAAMIADLGVEAVNLTLHARSEELFAADKELARAHAERQTRLKQMHDVYRIRLDHAFEATRAISVRQLDAKMQAEERQVSVTLLRHLDRDHLDRSLGIHAEWEQKWKPFARPEVARHRRELARLIEPTTAIVVAGGHVASLLYRMKLFDVLSLAGPRRWVAAAAGAMVLTERIYLFHDFAPHGTGVAEVLDAGLGLVRDLVVLPDPRHRLELTDHPAISRFVQRVAPATCSAMDGGARIFVEDGRVTRANDYRLTAEGENPPGVEALTTVTVESRPRAIEALKGGPKTPEDVNAFMAANKFPLVEGPAITFVWRGTADAVHLKHWVFGLPSSQQLTKVEGTDLFYLTFELPPGSRVEYKLEVVRNGNGEWIQDPLNSAQARDPFGANSVAHGEGYSVPSWIHHDPESRPGRMDEIIVEGPTFGRRGVGVYLPARYRKTRRYPLLVVHDGHDYLQYASLGPILDNLMHRLEIPEVIVCLTSSPARLAEYANDERHARWLTEELVPTLERALPIDKRPQTRCLMGASFGAVAALSTAWRKPGFYGRLLLQSGSFAFTDIGQRNHRGPLFDPVVAFMNQFRARPVAVAERVFVSCGMYESLIYENRSLVPLLRGTGMDVRFVEARDGHNWENWRDRLREGLSWLFPGPFLMVYE